MLLRATGPPELLPAFCGRVFTGRESMPRRSMLVLLAATALAGAYPDGQQSNGELIAALRAEKRPARRVYKSSVSELEERQRSVGASIEYLDDLSAAYR